MTQPTDHVRELRGVTHALNNALTPVLADAQLVQVVLGPDSQVADELQHVVDGARQANDLVHELRAAAERLAETLEELDG
jgi:methyl-accepting chemotaxis protein